MAHQIKNLISFTATSLKNASTVTALLADGANSVFYDRHEQTFDVTTMAKPFITIAPDPEEKEDLTGIDETSNRNKLTAIILVSYYKNANGSESELDIYDDAEKIQDVLMSDANYKPIWGNDTAHLNDDGYEEATIKENGLVKRTFKLTYQYLKSK